MTSSSTTTLGYDRMSPALRRSIAEADAEERLQAAKVERERRYRAELWQQRSEEAARQTAIIEAMEAGEDATRALRGEQLGHTHGEFLALMSARQDHEDMRAEAEQRQAFRRWQAGETASTSADMSAPTQRQLDDEQLMQERARRYREREYERRLTERGIRAGAI